MFEFEMKVHQDHLIINGKIGLNCLTEILKDYTEPNWIADPEWAEEVGANFVFCTRNASSHRLKNAVSQ